MSWYGFAPYVSVAQRRAKATREMNKLAKKGRTITPVKIEGLKIARTFWGMAWCDHLESYSDFENRLPRGRTYVRNGSVVDLQIEPGRVTAIVSGSELYKVAIEIEPLTKAIWKCLKGECGGQIGSLVELLQGRLSESVMELVTRKEGGLFPKPAHISMKCSCPDWADMCKHVAAVLYGVGARLDQQPDLLFKLRKVDHLELIAEASAATVGGASAPATQQTIAADDLADVLGIELDAGVAPAPAPPRPPAKAEADATRTRTARRAKRQPGKTVVKKAARIAAVIEQTPPAKSARGRRKAAGDADAPGHSRKSSRRRKTAAGGARD